MSAFLESIKTRGSIAESSTTALTARLEERGGPRFAVRLRLKQENTAAWFLCLLATRQWKSSEAHESLAQKAGKVVSPASGSDLEST